MFCRKLCCLEQPCKVSIPLPSSPKTVGAWFASDAGRAVHVQCPPTARLGLLRDEGVSSEIPGNQQAEQHTTGIGQRIIKRRAAQRHKLLSVLNQ